MRDEIRDAQRTGRAATARFRLPFRSRTWRGASGDWQGAGVGSSIDFQDHRPYFPGDDPRYIDWQAYARSGQYTMKLFREEVSPLVDVIFDSSPSMFLGPAKAARSWELLFFSVDSARQSGAAVRLWAMRDQEFAPWPIEMLRTSASLDDLVFRRSAPPPRRGAMRVMVSDLLYPATALDWMQAPHGLGLVFAPSTPEEREPAWEGNVEFVDCESGGRELRRVSPDLLVRYREAYRRHFDLWREQGRRRGITVAHVPAELALPESLAREALPRGAVELSAG